MFWKTTTLCRNDWATFHVPLTSDAIFMACGTFLTGHLSSQPDIWLKSVGIRDEISARTSRIERGSAANLTAKLQIWFSSCQRRRFWETQLAWLAGSCRASYWQIGNRRARQQHGRSHVCCSECEELHTHSPIRMQRHVLRALHMYLVVKTADSGHRSVIVQNGLQTETVHLVTQHTVCCWYTCARHGTQLAWYCILLYISS